MNFRSGLKSAMLTLGVLLMNVLAFAQDTTLEVSTTTKSATETTEIAPWMWIVGGAVLLLLLIALLRPKNNASTDRVTVTKTVEKD